MSVFVNTAIILCRHRGINEDIQCTIYIVNNVQVSIQFAMRIFHTLSLLKYESFAKYKENMNSIIKKKH